MDWAEFRDWLSVDSDMEQTTIGGYLGALRRAKTLFGFDPDAYLASAEAAKREGRRVLAQARRLGPNPYNALQRPLNALARWRGLEGVAFPKAEETRSRIAGYARWELRKLLNYRSPRRGWRGRQETLRRRALIWFALYSAARQGEIHRARTGDLDPKAPTFRINRPSKRGPPRTLPVEPEFYSPHRPLQPWLRERPIVASDPAAIWTSSLRGGPRVLTLSALEAEIQRAGREVGVRANFMRFRKTRATMLWRATRDVLFVKEYLGHSKVETTVRYIEGNLADMTSMLRRSRPKSLVSPGRGRKLEESDDEPQS